MKAVGILDAPADVQGEFDLPTERFDDAGGGDLFIAGVGERDFNVGSFLKRRDFEVDAQTATIGIRFGGEAGDARLFGDGAGEVVFGKEKIHGEDYNGFGK